jgi:succinate dehydrogenase / fumarate reductase iron-sulfur subunit
MDFTLNIWRQDNASAQGSMKEYKVTDISSDTSFLEMLDVLNQNLIEKNEEPISFDNDCREGVCGTCSLYINGEAHGPKKISNYLSIIYAFF